jgi:hypothetical protein
VFEFEAEQPVGVRSCCDLPMKTGDHQHEWLMTEVDAFVDEYERLQKGELEPRLSRRHHLDAVAQFRSLMGRAAKGQLPVGEDGTMRARRIYRVPYLIELRPAFSGRGSQPRLFRLYYAEPLIVPRSLLPLVLSTKPASDDNAEQNLSIDDAQARSRTWTMYRTAGRLKK